VIGHLKDDHRMRRNLLNDRINAVLAAVFLDGNGMEARHCDTGLDGERYGESQQRKQGA
jgi:dsRNA-specific ribonuclease